MVHAGRTADATQHLLEIRAQHRRAAIVHQHHMVLVRPIQIALPPRPGGERRVDREILPGGRARQQPQQAGGILERRHDLLDARQHDMDARQRLGQVAVALVGDDHRAAGLRDQEIRPGDADIGGQELLPQLGPRLGQDVAALVEHPVSRQIGVRLAKLLLPVLAVKVEGRGDDVARQLVAQLDNVFAEIGLHRRDAVALQVLVHADLLGDHALALGHRPRAGLLADRQHLRTGIVRGGAPMQLPAGCLQLRLVRLEVEIEVGQRVVLDVPADIAQLLEFRQPRHRRRPPADERRPGIGQRLLQSRIGDGGGGVLLEGGTGDDVHAGVLLNGANLAEETRLGTPAFHPPQPAHENGQRLPAPPALLKRAGSPPAQRRISPAGGVSAPVPASPSPARRCWRVPASRSCFPPGRG